MKIAILLYSMAGGGAERVISYFLPFLLEKNIEVHLVLMNSTFHYNIPKSIPVHYIENSRPNENGLLKLIKLPYLAYKYNKLIKKIKPSHSFSLLNRPNYINLLSSRFVKGGCIKIISERNFPSKQYEGNSLSSLVNKFLIKSLYPNADLIIPNSIETMQDLINNFNCPDHKVKVIYNPIDLNHIDSIKPIEKFFDKNYFNIISVGRLQPVKNHELLIKSIAKCENVRLYILGQGVLKGHLEEIIDSLDLTNKVFLLGFDNNPYKYLKSADLFVLSSKNEGFPNVLLEAMACGLPIISTNCKSGPSELMELEKEKEGLMYTKFGILVPVDDCKSMAKAITELSQSPNQYSNKCRNRAREFELEGIMEEFLNAISKA